MKYPQLLFIFLFSLILSTSLQARQLSVQAVGGHSSNSQNQYPLDGGVLESDRGYFTIGESGVFNPESWSISYQNQKAGFLETREQSVYLTIFETSGNKIVDRELEFFDVNDETLKLYLFDNGRSVTRDNVANFTFFDPDGELIYSVSNSSQSSEGERESELAASAYGNTIVLYNPVINYGESRGSRAKVVFGENDQKVFFRDESAQILQVKVSESGSYITLLTGDGSNYGVYIFDRFGNELNQFSFDDEQKGVSISDDAQFVTVYSGGRTQVLNALTGERVGSTSSRSPVINSRYFENDDVILVFGGVQEGNRIDRPTVSAIHIGQRQILREEINESLSIYDVDRIDITQLQSNSYRIDGLNRSLNIQADF
jgi:hypothetical protein